MPQKIPFRVVHVSGQDDQFKAVELNHHSPTTKGWQSSRFCLYPQDIVLQLEDRYRIRKVQILSHQYLIATKIEFYVGDVPDGTPISLQNARYTRLGYVALSDNDKTGFKARELKSVHVDALGIFVKFVIHKNHINKHNIYNQVGIIALNIIGDDITILHSDRLTQNYGEKDAALLGKFNKPDYISPLDDLAFDMYQDPEVADIIRKLERKKQEAVLQERYDFAKKVKEAVYRLYEVGEKLGKFEVEKRQAVENEDYDKAKIKKLQMDEYRLHIYKQLEIEVLLEIHGAVRYQPPVDLEPTRQPTPPRLAELPQRSDTPPKTPYEERPLPAIKKEDEYPARPPSEQPYDDRPLPVHKNQDDEGAGPSSFTAPPPDDAGNVTGDPEAMSEQDQREASAIIEAFGLPLVSKAYSKTWSFREDALTEIQEFLEALPSSASREESRNLMRHAVYLTNKSIKDKVLSVYTSALVLLKYILTDYAPKHRVGKQEVSYAVDKTLPNILQKTGDAAARMRESAKQFIVEESMFHEVKPLHAVPTECVKPFKLNLAPRLALSRTEILESLYRTLGLNNSGLSIDNMMRYLTIAIQHHDGNVRSAAENLIIELYKDGLNKVKDYLPPDDDKTRKNVLYKQLFEAFDKADGKPTKDDLKKKQKDQDLAKQREIAELQNQLKELRDMAAGKQPVDDKAIKDEAATPAPKGKKKKGEKAKPAPEPTPAPEDDVSTLIQLDHTCIFCGEKNDTFTEEGLDLHYWKSCPMLKRCSFCKQVVEIAGYSDHLLSECDAKDNYEKCPRCTEAITKADFDQHIKDKTCPPAEPGKNHCPLCHLNFTSGEEEWKGHLMGKDGCKQNPRRIQSLNKQAQVSVQKTRVCSLS